MIFDDLLLEKQNKCESYYVRGRHSNVDCFYLCQNYFKLPRQTIRENANFICLFPQDLKNINHIYNDHVSQDMSKEEFRKLCKSAWNKPFGFVVIDLTSKKDNGKCHAQFPWKQHGPVCQRNCHKCCFYSLQCECFLFLCLLVKCSLQRLNGK